ESYMLNGTNVWFIRSRYYEWASGTNRFGFLSNWGESNAAYDAGSGQYTSFRATIAVGYGL
ncbi:MAG: hypothetical protein PHY26_03335, partial [Bacilli bacterium]|nr:hypothetical protein [Bacilli bacterium]